MRASALRGAAEHGHVEVVHLLLPAGVLSMRYLQEMGTQRYKALLMQGAIPVSLSVSCQEAPVPTGVL